mmetsp:Transcript_4927/g.5692  ORF Transcript_4927/g.5692 Transcript_4927/m.5692 type:complete len:206 (-) Transcript_4927:67-684(-)
MPKDAKGLQEVDMNIKVTMNQGIQNFEVEDLKKQIDQVDSIENQSEMVGRAQEVGLIDRRKIMVRNVRLNSMIGMVAEGGAEVITAGSPQDMIIARTYRSGVSASYHHVVNNIFYRMSGRTTGMCALILFRRVTVTRTAKSGILILARGSPKIELAFASGIKEFARIQTVSIDTGRRDTIRLEYRLQSVFACSIEDCMLHVFSSC